MNQDQLTSLVRTALKGIGAILTYHGATQTAGWLNAEDVVGAVILLAGLLWSHIYHKDEPATPPTTGTGTLPPQ